MLGRKTFEPKLFYQVSLEERVPEDHLLRRVAAVVDFAFVRRLTARFYSHTVQPGGDPASCSSWRCWAGCTGSPASGGWPRSAG